MRRYKSRGAECSGRCGGCGGGSRISSSFGRDKICGADRSNVSCGDGHRICAGRAGRGRSAGIVRRRRGRPVRVVGLRSQILRRRIGVAIVRIPRRRAGRAVIRAIARIVIGSVVWIVVGRAISVVIGIVGISARVVVRIVRRPVVISVVIGRVVVSGPVAVIIRPSPA